MIVMKFGGSTLQASDSIFEAALRIASASGKRIVAVLSAFDGVTDTLLETMRVALESENSLQAQLSDLSDRHHRVARECIPDSLIRNKTFAGIDQLTIRLQRLCTGISYTGEVTPRLQDHILSMGERLAVTVMAGILEARGRTCALLEGDGIDLVGRGPWGNASADLKWTRELLPRHIHAVLREGKLPLVTGFFGQRSPGVPLTFGRGGSDYVAAVLAACLEADRLEMWKDVDGFLSAAPQVVTSSRIIPSLSYDEAAELAYFGAGILHPRTVEPLLDTAIPIYIRNTFHPDNPGTIITKNSPVQKGVIKSVTYKEDIALLRVHGADVGYATGLLGILVSALGQSGVNIRSVMTSQTCINILLDRSDLDPAEKTLRRIVPSGIDQIEPVDSIGLVAVVGQGLAESEGCLTDVIGTINKSGSHVHLVVSGASRVAAYFIVPRQCVNASVQAVHRLFLNGND